MQKRWFVVICLGCLYGMGRFIHCFEPIYHCQYLVIDIMFHIHYITEYLCPLLYQDETSLASAEQLAALQSPLQILCQKCIKYTDISFDRQTDNLYTCVGLGGLNYGAAFM